MKFQDFIEQLEKNNNIRELGELRLEQLIAIDLDELRLIGEQNLADQIIICIEELRTTIARSEESVLNLFTSFVDVFQLEFDYLRAVALEESSHLGGNYWIFPMLTFS